MRRIMLVLVLVGGLAGVTWYILTPATGLRYFISQTWPGLIPDDEVLVTDNASGIAGAELFQFDERGRLKYSHAAWTVPLNDPDWRASADADHMRPDDWTLGLYFHGKSWAIPSWIIKNHHVANLTLDGQPVAIAFCEKCSSGLALDPVANGRRLTFHVAGVYNGSILISDYETKSYWTPFIGEALEGPLKGATMKHLQLIQCRWRDWLQVHPEGLVAYGAQNLRKGHGDYHTFGDDDAGFVRLLRKPLDKRLRFNELVLGVTTGSEARAYPLSILDALSDGDQKNVVVNDTLGSEDIVILHQRGSWLTTVFSRRLGEKTLQFVVEEDGSFVDSIYHSRWNYQGEALDNPIAGQRLTYITSRVEKWYIWPAYYPTTSIFGNTSAKAD